MDAHRALLRSLSNLPIEFHGARVRIDPRIRLSHFSRIE